MKLSEQEESALAYIKNIEVDGTLNPGEAGRAFSQMGGSIDDTKILIEGVAELIKTQNS